MMPNPYLVGHTDRASSGAAGLAQHFVTFGGTYNADIRTYVSDRPACLLAGPKTKQHVAHRTCSAQCLSGGAY